MSKAMAEISRLQELKKQEEERIRKEEEAKAAKAAAEEKAAESVPEPVEVVQKSEKTAQNTAGITQKEEVAPHENEKVESGEKTVLTGGMSIDTPDTTAGAKKVAEEDTKQYKASFTVYGTKAEIMDLKQFMIEHKIKFGKVEK